MEITKHVELLSGQLEQLVTSTPIRFDETCHGNLPALPGVYRIFDLDRPDETIRAGRTDISLRQRVYQNHLMGNQNGNLPGQLVGAGKCANFSTAKQFMRETLAVQVLLVADDRERACLEHFMLALLQPRFSDRSQR
jgi:hypothetical protein